MSKKDGGPAFPVNETHNANGESMGWATPGMTLRDHFAGQFLQGAAGVALKALGDLASVSNVVSDGEAKAIEDNCKNGLVKMAYEYADAMLKERER